MPEIPHPIPYQGSKRKLAPEILKYVPDHVDTLFEPFCGSAAISLAVAHEARATSIHINDSLSPLIELWRQIITNPTAVADAYETLWNGQASDARSYYDRVRDEFNRDHAPAKLLFLLARCVKNAVRFNASGQFNQSPDKRRLGTQPLRMRTNIFGASALLRKRTTLTSDDYSSVFERAGVNDLVYMDPPYQGTSGERDQRYHQPLDRERFVANLGRLLERGVPVIISFDGRCGDRTYGTDLPQELGLVRLDVHAGRSSQATLNGENADTIESLYVSQSLVEIADQRGRLVPDVQPAQPSLPITA